MNAAELNDWIKNKWESTFRTVINDEGNLIGLPYSFAVPCSKGKFQEMYYWDTYFASRGLALHGMTEFVLNHCENFFCEIDRFGFIPNGSRTYYLNRSQPPYLGATIKLVNVCCRPGKDWISKAAGYLERELDFWMTRRSLPNGLQHYGHHENEQGVEDFYSCCTGRLGMPEDAPREFRLEQSSHTMAEAESGWDFNPRFDRRCMDFAAIDLNSLLYYDEMLLADLYKTLDEPDKSGKWLDKAENRKKLLNKYCWDSSRGAFLDYDSKNDKFSAVLSAASLHPLWAGLASEAQAASTVATMEKNQKQSHSKHKEEQS